MYRLVKLLGKGGFGAVYAAENVKTGVVDALKLKRDARKQLKREWTKLVALNGTGIPQAYWFGRVDEYWCLLMQGLELSLADKFAADKRNWSIETLARIAIQLINVLERVHEKHMVHNDIKPLNLLLDKRGQQIYLIDFGMSYYYVNRSSGVHYELPQKECDASKEGLQGIGTATFSSVRAHEHVRLSRRDDIESMAFNLAFWLNGGLPWYLSEKIERAERNKRIYAVKVATSPEELFRGHPHQMRQLLEHARALAYDAKPDYDLMRSWMRELLVERGADPNDLNPW